MADTVQVNVGGTYKELDKGYVNIGGVWKELDKIWVNIGGVWKEVGLELVLSYYGTATNISGTITPNTTAKTPNHMLFAVQNEPIDCYNSSLIKTTATTTGFTGPIGAYNASYAVFASDYWSSSAICYNVSLVKSSTTNLDRALNGMAGTTSGNHAIIAGGIDSGDTVRNTANVYDNSMTKIVSSLPSARYSMGCGYVVGYALFYGGADASYTRDNVYAFNDSNATWSTITNLTQTMSGARGFASLPSYGLLHLSGTTINAYSNSLVRTTINLSNNLWNGVHRGNSGANGYAIFPLESYSSNVEVFNDSLVRTLVGTMSESKNSFSGGSIGKYTLLAGGNASGSNTSKVEVFQVG